MDDLGGLDARLAAALDRIAASHARQVEDLREARDARASGAGDADTAALKTELADARSEMEALHAALEEERRAVAEITSTAEAERETASRLRAERDAAAASSRLGAVQDGAASEENARRLTDLEAALDRLRAANAQLRINNAALRKAAAAGGADAALLEDGMQAEIDALRAAREADRAEIDSILQALKPIVEEGADA